MGAAMGGGPPMGGGMPPGGPPPGGPNPAAAQAVMGRMTGGGPPGGPGEAGPVPPEMVQQGRQMLQQLTALLTQHPALMAALKDDIIGFGMTIKQFAGMAGGQPGGPPPGGPPGMGGPPPGGPPPGGPPMGGGGAPPGM